MSVKPFAYFCQQFQAYHQPHDPESKNEEDQWDQKELWIKLHEKAQFYSQSAFREGLNAEAFIHHDGVTQVYDIFAQCFYEG